MRGVRLLYLGLLPVLDMSLLVVLPSKSKPLSNQFAYRQRNQYPDGHLLFKSRDIRRSLIPLLYSLSLPPASMMVILRLAIWYAPHLLRGSLSTTALVYLFQVVHCAILFPLRTESLQPCYNITYMTAGGLEPPRQLASGCQDRYVCQFHHAVGENRGSAPAKLLLPPTPLQNIIKGVYLFVNIICGNYIRKC